ncbi:MAG: fatty acid desaturase [Pseudomonadota bacterium]
MAQLEAVADYAAMSAAELDLVEREISAPFLREFPLGIVLWGLSNAVIWLALWPLVFMDILPLWLAFPIATLNVALSYLPSHDAQHNIIARRGQRLRWLNELVGHVSVIPLATSFRVLRATHMEHHRHTNDPALDPDYDTHAENTLDFFRKHIGNGFGGRYTTTLARIGRNDLVLEGVLFNLGYLLILFALAWSGHALEAAFLWWLPQQIAVLWLRYYLSWVPHHPGTAQGRYRDTRAFKSLLGNLFSGGMQYHIVHHLYPTIPLMRTPAAYRALRPILEQRGCDLGGL